VTCGAGFQNGIFFNLAWIMLNEEVNK